MNISRQQAGEAQVPRSSSNHRRRKGVNDDDDEEEEESIFPYSLAPMKEEGGGIMEKEHRKKNKISGGRVVVRYRECQKNHAATMGGNARDGCGEFMASGEEGTLEALKCSACNCHRNFHRKETYGDQMHGDGDPNPQLVSYMIIPSYNHTGAGKGRTSSRMTSPDDHHHMMIPTESEEINVGGDGSKPFPCPWQPSNDHDQGQGKLVVKKKRFRTKFTQEQKEKMLRFAERADWRIQKLEESVVHHFCQEIGIKRRVLKVWMHNNKHIFSSTSTKPST